MSIILGKFANQKGTDPFFRLAREDRRLHVYTIGKTGLGKSTLLLNALLQDVEAGDGVALLDPHGDLAEQFLDQIPPDRTQDVIYFNPADVDYPAGLNLLHSKERDKDHLVVSGVVSSFKHLWGDSWGPRLEYILANTLSTVVELGNGSLLSVLRILNDPDFRARTTRQVRDPILSAFWEKEFAGYDDRFRAEAVAPIQNKLGRLLSSPLLRNILGQVTSTFDVDQIMADRKIFVANLSRGRLGEDNSNLLGSLLVSSFQLGAMRRAELDQDDRPDFFLFIDEFQNFGTDAFSSILSEARKYKLSLFLAHQYIDQLPEQLRHAIFGNVGSVLSFGVSARDAKLLEPSLPIPARNLVELGKYDLWTRLASQGVPNEPFRGSSLPPPAPLPRARLPIITRRSQQHHARRRRDVEEKIERWLASGLT